MLELKNIVKDYVSGNNVTHALKGISVNFRKNEFVSILGASGCGKTTTLNIIGGLDRYTSGDLIIKGKSTKNYSDRDWDTYRNHSVGFVFQTYNLIPHLSILKNVELALSISGYDRKIKTEKAQKALERVGLGDITKKKPNQLSGGQCQRVAIARALVNDPEIVLADEPTGALDSETSVQIMDLLKEVAKDRLVIMVTHNPDLAKKYSSRIITMKDGELLNDSNPFDGKEKAEKLEENKKPKMSLPTAFVLSARNLLAKAKRTSLVCVAGSIGIIGVSTVLAVSTGVKSYIRNMQDDMLSGNPITIERATLDFAGLMNSFAKTEQANAVKQAIEDGKVNVDSMVKYLAEQKNNLESYAINNSINEDYVQFVKDMPKEFYSAFEFNYGINYKMNIFTDVAMTGDEVGSSKERRLSLESLEKMYVDIVKNTEFGDYASVISLFTNTFYNAPDNPEYLLGQYDILNQNGYIATEEDEMMLVVSKDRELTDIFLGQLGYYTQNEFVSLVNKYAHDHQGSENPYSDESTGPSQFDYSQLTGKTFYYVPYKENYVFTKNPLNNPEGVYDGTTKVMGQTLTGQYIDQPLMYNGEATKSNPLPEGAKPIKITAILQPKETVSYGCLNRGFVMSAKFQEKVLKDAKDSDAVRLINESLEKYNTLGVDDGTKDEARLTKEKKMKEAYTMIAPYFYQYNYSHFDENQNKKVIIKGFNMGQAMSVANLSGGFSGGIFDKLMGNSYSIENQFASQLRTIGGIDDVPTSISIYPKSFDEKGLVTRYLDRWNDKDQEIKVTINGVEKNLIDREDITYNDNLQIIIGLINTMIEIITIALVCFTSLSLVVSTVMIGIITYVSVVERIKEIGLIRSLGGRKIDVSNLFNVETFIIGLVSGLFGIAVTYGLSGIINLIINSISKVKLGTLVILPWNYALIIIGISILLTLISGLIPARAAAHKDPVVALRSAE